MKKFLSFILPLSFAAACFSCGENKDISLTEARTTEDGKSIVTVGSFGRWFNIPDLNDTFNMPADIEVELVNFNEGIENDYTDERAFMQARQSIISGEAPDIIALPPEYMIKLYNAGALTDLYELMDEYGGVQADEFLPNVIESFELDGELPAVAESFYINTYYAKTSNIGKEYESWTPEEAMEFFKNMPEGMRFMEANDGTDTLIRYMTKMSYTDHAVVSDLQSGDFSGGSFGDILRFCTENIIEPDRYSDTLADMPADEARVYWEEFEYSAINDTQLIFDVQIGGLDNQLTNGTFRHTAGEDITFVGFPTENGSGADVHLNSDMYAISKRSGNKEKAWELLSYIIKQRPRKDNTKGADYGIPVLKKQLESDYNASSDYYNSVNKPTHFPGSPLDSEHEVRISDEYKDMLCDYIKSVKLNVYAPYEIKNIIDEECDAVLAGEKTPEECIDILNSRVSLYLSENS